MDRFEVISERSKNHAQSSRFLDHRLDRYSDGDVWRLRPPWNARAGVLLLMAVLYHHYMEQTNLNPTLKVWVAVIVLVGILAQSGGFFLHMAIGQPGALSLGTTITSLGRGC